MALCGFKLAGQAGGKVYISVAQIVAIEFGEFSTGIHTTDGKEYRVDMKYEAAADMIEAVMHDVYPYNRFGGA